MKRLLLLCCLLMWHAAYSGQNVPCELDPFCDDADGPIEVPLDRELFILVAGGLALALSKFRNKKSPDCCPGSE